MRYEPMERRVDKNGKGEFLCQLCGAWVPFQRISRFEEGACNACYEGVNEENVHGGESMVKVRGASYWGEDTRNPLTNVRGDVTSATFIDETLSLREIMKVMAMMEADGLGELPVLANGGPVVGIHFLCKSRVIHINHPRLDLGVPYDEDEEEQQRKER